LTPSKTVNHPFRQRHHMSLISFRNFSSVTIR